MNEEQEWRPIRAAIGGYEISNHGQVRNAVSHKRVNGYFIKSGANQHSLFMVMLGSRKGRRLTFQVKTLVASHFVDTSVTNGGQVINVDGDLSNNHVSNLRITTIHDSQSIHLCRRVQLCNNPNQKLTPDDVREIRQLRTHLDAGFVARRFGVHPTTISDVISGRTWWHVE